MHIRQDTAAGAGYVHGCSARESERLCDQAETLTALLHRDTCYPAGSSVLEAGCGVGAQTVILVDHSPGAQITSVDISDVSLRRARERVQGLRIGNVRFLDADIAALPFKDASFDHVFVCFVLEHLRDPAAALAELRRVLVRCGSITVIEGDHGSAYFHPASQDAMRLIRCLETLQADMGGNACIGRQLYPLLTDAGFANVAVSPRMVYVDASRPGLVEGFTKNTFIAMIEGIEEEAVGRGMVDAAMWKKGIADLYRTTEPDGTFCYTFFRATAVKE